MEGSVGKKGASSEKNDAAPDISNSQLLGEIAWLWSFSYLHSEWPIGSIQQWILPALMHNQFRIYRRDGKPRGYVSWAWMTKENEEQYVLNTSSLQPVDWVGGDRGWIIDYVAPFGDAREIARDLKYNVFVNDVGRSLRVHQNDDTMKIRYLHGAKAIDKAKDWENNPTVELKGDLQKVFKHNASPN